jgi:hypothetical protein
MLRLRINLKGLYCQIKIFKSLSCVFLKLIIRLIPKSKKLLIDWDTGRYEILYF